ncbi:hypothetical protein [Janibacter sp. GS2]|uniref:hypothetical protein n=1 Tax=Janibacter sp. GS2 TaxID=3442646 RepID=UPI003EB894BE
MTATSNPVRAVRCCLCSWTCSDADPAVRESKWLAHYYGLHPQPLWTRCTVPPFCGWSTTADDLTTLRRLKAAHESTHQKANETR